jgi:hypothetical protein
VDSLGYIKVALIDGIASPRCEFINTKNCIFILGKILDKLPTLKQALLKACYFFKFYGGYIY